MESKLTIWILKKLYKFIKWFKPKFIAITLIILLVLSVMPVIYVSFFNHPYADDYGFGKSVYNVLQNGGGIKDILKTCVKLAAETYNTWQGTFSAIMLFCLQPAVFSDKIYFLTTFILLGSLVISTFLLIKTFVKHFVSPKYKWHALSIAAVICFASVQYMPYPKDSLFWFNGGIFYTFFYSLALMLASGIINLLDSKKNNIIKTVLLSIYAFFVCGGNYATALVTVFILVVLSIYLFVSKNEKKIHIGVITCISLISLLISATAPGNAVRAATINHESSVIGSIISSILYAGYSILKWTRLPQFAVFLIFSPVLYKMAGESKLKFDHPIFVSVISFGFFAAQYTPTYFAVGLGGPERLIDITYFAYYIFICFELFYAFGFIQKQIINKNSEDEISIVSKITGPFFTVVSMVGMVLFVIGVYGINGVYWENTLDGQIINYLKAGYVEEYHTQYMAQIEELEKEDPVVYIENIENCPPFLNQIYAAPEDSPQYWINTFMAGYYGHEKVLLKEKAE